MRAVQVAIAPAQRRRAPGRPRHWRGGGRRSAAARRPASTQSRELRAGAAADLGAVRQDDRRHLAGGQLGDRAVAHLGPGRQRPLDVVELRQQRLRRLRRRLADQADHAAPPALVEQDHAADRLPRLELEARDAVAAARAAARTAPRLWSRCPSKVSAWRASTSPAGPSALIAPCCGAPAPARRAATVRRSPSISGGRSSGARRSSGSANTCSGPSSRQLLREAAGRFARRRRCRRRRRSARRSRPRPAAPARSSSSAAMRSTGHALGFQLEAVRTASVALRRRRFGAVGSGAVPSRMTSRLSRWARAVNRSRARRRSSQAGRGGPAVVDHQDERPVAAQLRLRIEHRPGERQDQQRGEQQPQQQQPGRGARRGLAPRAPGPAGSGSPESGCSAARAG